MQTLEELRRGVYKRTGVKELLLDCPLDSFPPEILELGNTLELLDLSDSGLSSLPANIGRLLPKLEILSLADCAFSEFPSELASCPNLVMVNFRNNGMTTIPEGALPSSLRWLFLTDNKLESLPDSIGNCSDLKKCMLSGNQLHKLPSSMARCRELSFLRLSSNKFRSLPSWLFRLPKLAYLSFAGNPCSSGSFVDYSPCPPNRDWVYIDAPAQMITMANIRVRDGELSYNETSVTHEALMRRPRKRRYNKVVFKMFLGSNFSHEMLAHLKAGHHPNLICPIAWFRGHLPHWAVHSDETFHGGLVMQRMPLGYHVLAAGRSKPYPSVHRNNNPVKIWQLPVEDCLKMLQSICDVAWHLHNKGIAHGDLFAHNVYYNTRDGGVRLVDFAAATIYTNDELEDARPYIERIEVLAFAKLLHHVLSLVNPWYCWGRVMDPPGWDRQALDIWRWDQRVLGELDGLKMRCSSPSVSSRPSFFDLQVELQSLVSGYKAVRDYYLYPMCWTTVD